MQSCFETTAIGPFVFSEFARIILLFLGITYTNPPSLASSVNAFGAVTLEDSSPLFHDVVVRGRADHNRSALPQSVLIKENFVFRNPAGELVLNRAAPGRAGDRAADSQSSRA